MIELSIDCHELEQNSPKTQFTTRPVMSSSKISAPAHETCTGIGLVQVVLESSWFDASDGFGDDFGMVTGVAGQDFISLRKRISVHPTLLISTRGFISEEKCMYEKKKCFFGCVVILRIFSSFVEISSQSVSISDLGVDFWNFEFFFCW